MACRGVFFAVTEEQKEHLLTLESDEQRLEYIQEEIEQPWDESHLLETDKAWDAIHRCLTDGSPKVARSANPLGKLIAGENQIYSDPQSYIINLVEHSELSEISVALKTVTKEWLRERYDRLHGTDYPQELITEQDCEYTVSLISSTAPPPKDAASYSQSTSRADGERGWVGGHG